MELVKLPCTLHPLTSVASLPPSTFSVPSSSSLVSPPSSFGVGTRRPCKSIQEITFSAPVKLDFITFRNFYTASITIKQLIHKTGKGQTHKQIKSNQKQQTFFFRRSQYLN